MSESKEKRLRALEHQRDELTRALMDANHTHVHLLDEIKSIQKSCDAEYLKARQELDDAIQDRDIAIMERDKATHERHVARAEKRAAAHSAKSWKVVAYISLAASAVVMLLAIAGQTHQAKAAEVRTAVENPVEAVETSVPPLPAADPLADYHRLDNVTVSHYCICPRCCGKTPDDPGYGITASGRRAVPGYSIAVDPHIIPLGTEVLVDYGDGALTPYRADDTGATVQGNHIDLCMESHDAALQAGIKTASIYWKEATNDQR